MADAVVVQEFLATLGYRVDEASQRRFVDSLESIGKTIAGLGLGLTGLAGTIMGVVSSMAGSASQMNFVAQNLGESVTNIERAIYMWQRLGVAPAATLHAMQAIKQLQMTDIGRFNVFSAEQYGGKGSPEQQMEHFLERFRTASEAQRRIMIQQFGDMFDPSMLLAAASRGGQAGAGGDEFNFVNRLFHFDPDRFGRESSAFEQAWMGFHLRLNTWFKSTIAEPLTVLETQGLVALSAWIDKNGPEIEKQLESIGRNIRDAFMVGVDVIKDLIGWFEKLPPGAQHAAEAIAAIGEALLLLKANPTIIALAGFAYVLEKLVKDYEAWKEAGSKGPSPLGIDYAEIGKGIETILTKIDAVAQALGGWQNVLLDLALVVGGAKFLGVFVSAFTAIRAGAIATGTAIAGEIGHGIAAATFGLTTLLGLTLPLKGDEHLTDDQKKQRDKRTEDEARQYFQSHPEWAQQHPDDARRLGVVPGQQAPQAQPTPQQGQPGQQQEPLWFRRLMDLVIPQAHGEELPQNLKQVDTSLQDLKETMDRWEDTILEQMLGKEFGGGGGGGPGGGGGGGGGRAGGAAMNWNDPTVQKALQYFMKNGYSMEDAVAITSNLMAESNLNPGAVNPTGHVGIAQWDFSRQATFMREHGKRLTDATLDEQLAYVNEEITKRGIRQQLDSASSVRDKTAVVHHKFEGAEEWDLGRRQAMADRATIPHAPLVPSSMSNIANNQRSINLSVQNTNNVSSTDPGLAANELDRMHQRQWSDLQRRLQPTFR